jgi:hypothetical protein
MGAKPTHLGRRFCRVDVFPMCLRVHFRYKCSVRTKGTPLLGQPWKITPRLPALSGVYFLESGFRSGNSRENDQILATFPGLVGGTMNESRKPAANSAGRTFLKAGSPALLLVFKPCAGTLKKFRSDHVFRLQKPLRLMYFDKAVGR